VSVAPPQAADGRPGIQADDWAKAVVLVQEADEVCLACHVRPDGDALGSMLAVAHALRAGGRPGRPRVIASFGDQPFEIPEILRFLPGLDLLSPPGYYPERPRLMVTFDVGSIDRLGLLAPNASRADELIVVDHHASNTRFGTVHLIDPDAAATAVLAWHLISALGRELTREIAFGLYAGLVTDTGSFKYSSTSPAVHELAARLLGTSPVRWRESSGTGLRSAISACCRRPSAGRNLTWTRPAGTAWSGRQSPAPTGWHTACLSRWPNP
jgi:phosphoesterase RecJ-like protein